ncbi:VWA domain-containing protein [Haloferula rosea]|uniref:VWA domain-containing protein n=1 Tax=Haloferula rosea TaxID=490093 RepID=A0A934VGG2_9BACT|nr:VWA domain-containing protein [Haloferula rosea]MBK1828002.1 VWA domain-containing protein [Haloferula rosea]
MSFALPWLLLLVPVPFLVHWLVPPAVRRRPALKVPFMSRVSGSIPGGGDGTKHRVGMKWLPMLLWVLLVVAMARPQRVDPPIERSLPTRDLLLLIDLSTSMTKEDFTNAAGQPVDRLVAVKEVVGEFLAKRDGDRVGLVVFGSSAFLQVPFTTDLDLSRQLLGEAAIGMAGPRTALGDAIGLGIHLFEDSQMEVQTIIALTDGNDTESKVPPVEASRIARDRGITIHAVAVGDPETVGEEKLDEATLKEVASTSGGTYSLAMNRDELEQIYTKLDEVETTEVEVVRDYPRSDLFFWPLGLAVGMAGLAAAIRSGRRRRHDGREKEHRMRVNARTFDLEVDAS